MAYLRVIPRPHMTNERYWEGSPFADWSPAQLAHALGYHIRLKRQQSGVRAAFLVVPGGRAHPTTHRGAFLTLSRLAKRRGVDALSPPQEVPRAELA